MKWNHQRCAHINPLTTPTAPLRGKVTETDKATGSQTQRPKKLAGLFVGSFAWMLVWRAYAALYIYIMLYICGCFFNFMRQSGVRVVFSMVLCGVIVFFTVLGGLLVCLAVVYKHFECTCWTTRARKQQHVMVQRIDKDNMQNTRTLQVYQSSRSANLKLFAVYSLLQ